MCKSRSCLVLSLALLTTLVVSQGWAQAQSLPSDIDTFIEEVRGDWKVVGLAVAVVKDGEIAYARGFGERELGSGEAVDADTLFAIGSNTKAFTAAGVGLLVDEKKAGWDDRVIDHLPWFQLYDPYVTREITLRDLLSHRSGLGRRGDLNWYATDYDREEIVRRIRYLEPDSSFRSQAGYQNTMFLAVGEVTEAVCHCSWDDWVTTRILRPLGMERTLTSVKALKGVANVATPHEEIDGEIGPVPHRDIDNIAPAGSILSSVTEMSLWMRMLLAEGKIGDEILLSKEVVAELWKPNIIYPRSPESVALFPSTHFSTYGLGFGLRDYRGRFIVTHTGGIDGMLSQVLLVPEEKLGIVVLTNTSPPGSPAHSTITYQILDAYLGAGGETDWRRAFKTVTEEQRAATEAAEKRRQESRLRDTSPSLPLASYTGNYRDQMYGDMELGLEEGRLVVRRHTKWVGDLEHWHFDTFLVRWRDRVMGTSWVSFQISASGRVSAIEVEDVGTFDRLPTEEGGPQRTSHQ